MRTLFSICISFLLLFSASAQDTVNFLPHWSPQAQFAGYFMAVEKGFYDECGIYVNILPGGPEYPVKELIHEDDVDFASDFLSGGIKNYCRYGSIVNIGQLSTRSALMFIARKNSGIGSPEDFNEKKIGIWKSDFQELPLAFIQKFGIDAEIVPVRNTVNLFLWGGVDIMCVMWYNEYHQVYSSGIDFDELNTFYLTDYGLDFPEDGIYCKKAMWKKDSALCKIFVKATLKGWKYAFKHKEESLDIVLNIMKKANIQANRAHQRWMLDRMEDIMKIESNTGKLNFVDFQQTAEILLVSGEINFIPDFESFYKK